MWNRIRTFLHPPVFEGDDEKTKNARLLNSFLLVILGVTVLFPTFSIIIGKPLDNVAQMLVLFFVISIIAISILLRLGYVFESGVIFCLIFWGSFTYGAYNYGGLHDTAITGFLLLIVLASIVGGQRLLITFSGLAIFSLVGLYILEQLEIVIPDLSIPSDAPDIILPVIVVIGTASLLSIFINALTSANQKLQSSANQLQQANLELEGSRNTLAQQAKTLERRTRYLEASAIVARDVAAELNPSILLTQVATLITNQFEFYHTGIFLIDVAGEYAVLQAASSEGGQRMLANGHRLRVGQEGIVGYVSAMGTSRIALDTGEDAVYFDNPDLPETRSEAALPLRIGSKTIGVLDVQSTRPNDFSPDDVSVLQTLADQIGNALHTARLFQQVEESLEVQRRAFSDTSRETWQRLVKDRKVLGYEYVGGQVSPTGAEAADKQTDLPAAEVPIRLGDYIIGHITAHKGTPTEFWSGDEILVLENLSNQLGVALESARLYQDTQRRAAREQLTVEVTSRVRETLDIETIIKTASDEIRKALHLPEVVIRLGEPPVELRPGETE